MKINKQVTQNEVRLASGQTLVSKTDLKGNITYVNKEFVDVSGFTPQELVGSSQNIMRHPDMPAAVFKDLWDTVSAGKPWNGMVKNRCKNGDFYWVEDNIAPVFNNGEVTEYVSVRTQPSREQMKNADALYREVMANRAQLDAKPSFNPLQLWRGVSLKSRMNTLLAVLALSIFLMCGLGLASVRHSSEEMLRDGTLITQTVDTARSAQVHFKKQVQEWKNILLRGNDKKLFDKYLAKFVKEEAEVQSKLAELSSLAQQQPGSTAIASLVSDHAALGVKYRAALVSYEPGNLQSFQIVDKLVRGIDRPATKEMDKLVESVVSQQQANLAGLSRDVSSGVRQIFSFGAVAVLLLLATLAVWLSRSVLTPLRGVLSTFREISEGHYNNRIDTSRDDEVGRLLQALKSMQINLAFAVDKEFTAARESRRIKEALDSVSADVMVTDVEHNIIYLNDAIENMFRSVQTAIRKDLPQFDVNKLVNSNICALHNKPVELKGVLDGLSGIYRSELTLGGRTFRFVASPIVGRVSGDRLGAVVEWEDLTNERAIESEVQAIVERAKAGDLGGRIPLDNKKGFISTLSEGINDLLEMSDKVINETASVLGSMASGDLSQTINSDYQGAFGQLKRDTNTTLAVLTDVIGDVKTGASEISTGSEEISQGNASLSQRTEEQSASLQQTASSMEQMTSTVKQNADNATQANQLAVSACDQAEQGGAVVSQAVAAMVEINESSKKIAAIIGVIDEIAFQTNLLALNAAVEAARAGEQGRGFAVVASEVRNLAQRSAGAAKEIKSLIEDSVSKVDGGSRLVDESGRVLQKIVTSVKKVSDIIAEIAAAGQEQSIGIEEVNKAVMRMDEMTQQNAALVEQAAAASESMSDQAKNMDKSMAFFQIGVGASSAPQYERRSASRPWSGAEAAASSSHVADQDSESDILPRSATGTDGGRQTHSGDDWDEF